MQSSLLPDGKLKKRNKRRECVAQDDAFKREGALPEGGLLLHPAIDICGGSMACTTKQYPHLVVFEGAAWRITDREKKWIDNGKKLTDKQYERITADKRKVCSSVVTPSW